MTPAKIPSMAKQAPELVTVAGIAQRLGVSRQAIFDRIRRGTFPPHTHELQDGRGTTKVWDWHELEAQGLEPKPAGRPRAARGGHNTHARPHERSAPRSS